LLFLVCFVSSFHFSPCFPFCVVLLFVASQYYGLVFPLFPDLQQKLGMQVSVYTGLYSL
jgi:hypothetical protein